MRGEGGFNRPSRSLLQALPVAFSQMPPSSLITTTVEGHESQKKKKKKKGHTKRPRSGNVRIIYYIWAATVPKPFPGDGQVRSF